VHPWHRVVPENVIVIELVMTFNVKNLVSKCVIYCCVFLSAMKGRIQNEGV
jgi:hypothetical protein